MTAVFRIVSPLWREYGHKYWNLYHNKKAMHEHGLQILNTDADVREHRFYRYRAIRLE